VIGLYPFGRERQRIAQIGRKALICRLALRGINMPTRRIQVEAVKTLGHFGQSHIAARADITDGLRDDAGDIGIRLTPAIYQRIKCVSKPGLRWVKPLHVRPTIPEMSAPTQE
jgi:hypothetical protein